MQSVITKNTQTSELLESLNSNNRKRVLVGLSGGVDSAVSAALCVEAGFEVHGVFMKNWSDTAGLKLSQCPWIKDRQEALRVAAFLRIPLHTLDFEDVYKEKVMNYFFEEYSKGRTPNPDVMCNKEIKFAILFDWAKAQGYDYLATGHYAQIQTGEMGKAELVTSKDTFKDQTYFIHNLKGEQLSSILFPIGGYLKSEVREIATLMGLPNALRKESMGLCFVGKIQLREFLDQKIPKRIGNILDTHGNLLGKHEGLQYYTLGQRQGLGLTGGPFYVVKKDLESGDLVVATSDEFEKYNVTELDVHSLHLIWPEYEDMLVSKVLVRVRHQAELVFGYLKKHENKQTFVFEKPAALVASGQSLVFYDLDGKVCLGGAVVV